MSAGDGAAWSARDALAPLRLIESATPVPELEAHPGAREEVAAALAVTNAAYGHPRAGELAEALADPNTRVVITGQQAGFLGGPLLAAVKAAAAVRWAEALSAAGQPAVALFWMATEDHDFDEVARVTWPEAGELVRLDLGEDPAPLSPVGMRTLGPGAAEVIARLAACSGDPAFSRSVTQLERWFRPNARFGEAFARLLVAFLGDRAPLVVDAMLPELKRAQRPILRSMVERRVELARVTEEAEARVVAAGRSLQVRPQAGASPLFLLRGQQRRRIAWVGADHFTVRGSDEEPRPVSELLATIEDNPAVVSPGVLARPVVQDAVFGTALQVLGAAELAYLEQVAPSYRLLGVPAPAVVKRPSARVAEHRFERWLEGLGLDLSTVLGDEATLAARLAESHQLRREVAAVRGRIEAELERLAPAVLALEPQLERPWTKTRTRVLGGLDRLADKVDAAVVRTDERSARQIATMRTMLRPDGVPQERVLSVGWAWARFGPALGTALLDHLDLEPGRTTELTL